MQVTMLRVIVVLVGCLVTGHLLAGNPDEAARAQPEKEGRRRQAGGREAGDQKRHPVAVDVTKPPVGGPDRLTRQPCTVQAFESVQLYAAVSGYLKQMTVDIGDRVKRGQLLAEIDAPLLALDAKKAALAIRHAQGRVQEAEAGLSAAKAEVSAAGTVVQQRQAELANAKAKAVFAEAQVQRFQKLHENKSVDARLVQEKEQTREAARALVEAAVASLEHARANVQVKQSQAAQAEACLKVAQANREMARVALEKAQVLVQYASLRAPFDGVVTQRSMFVGDFVRAATDHGERVPLFTVQRTDLFRVVVQIPDRDAPYCNPGDPAQIELDALPGKKFSGKVSRVGFAEDPHTRLMRVEIDLANPKNILRPGMYGTATIRLRKGSPPAQQVPHIPNVPPGTLPPIELPFDPMATLPLGIGDSSQQGAQRGSPLQAGAQKGLSSKDAELALKKALVDEARKVYEQTVIRFRNGQGARPDDLYPWSRRWLEAQLELAGSKEARVAALRDHLDRMKDLEKITKGLADTGQGRTADASAGRFYRIQAELWLARGQRPGAKATNAAPPPKGTFWMDPRSGNQYFAGVHRKEKCKP
jgi:multidrug resistance efflux pump